MSVDISKIKPGDEVTVRFTVQDIGEHDVFLCRQPGRLSIVDAPVADIATHTPKALAVGDRVCKCWAHGSEVFTITAMDADGWAILSNGRGPNSRVLSSTDFLERVE